MVLEGAMKRAKGEQTLVISAEHFVCSTSLPGRMCLLVYSGSNIYGYNQPFSELDLRSPPYEEFLTDAVNMFKHHIKKNHGPQKMINC